MNSKNNLRLLFCFVITFIFATNFPASEVSATCSTSGGSTCVGYDLCIPSYAIVSGLKIRAQGDTCYTNCDQACQTTYSTVHLGEELNDDIISFCKLLCKSSIPFRSGKRANNLKHNSTVDSIGYTSLYTSNGKIFGHPNLNSDGYWMITPSISPVNINFNGTCTTNDLYAPYPTNLDTRNGGTITITLTNPDPGTANEVVLCGHDVRKLDPWYNVLYSNPTTTPFDSSWPSFNSSDWSIVYPGNNPSARSRSPADPILFIKNGDYLKISYAGKITANWTPDSNSIADFIFRKPDNTGNANSTHETSCGYTDCNWVSQDSNHYMYFLGRPDYSFDVNNLNAQNYGFARTSSLGQTTQISYKIGGGSTVNATIPYAEFVANPVQSFSSSFFRVGIQAIDRISPPSWTSYYNDNYGGLYFRFERKGCVYNNGQRIEYTVTPAGSPPPANAVWQMAPAFSANKSIITSTKNGKVWLRIAKMATSERSGVSCTTGQNETCNQQAGYYSLDDYQNQIYNNVSGQYYMNVEVNN
jgi:hypothetical protein